MAQADWVTRSTGPGVLWAHDFTNENEVQNFVPGGPNTDTSLARVLDSTLGKYAMQITVPGNSTGWAATVTNMVASAAGSGESASRITVTTATPHGIDPTDVGNVQWGKEPGLEGIRMIFTGLPGPWAVMNGDMSGGGGLTTCFVVKSIVSPTRYIVLGRNFLGGAWIETSGFAAYTSGGKSYPGRALDSTKGWERPFSVLSGATNGKGVTDVNNVSPPRPVRAWVPAYSAGYNTYTRWSQDFFGNAAYQVTDWTSNSGFSFTNVWHGTDYWLQFRVKISADRWNLPTDPDVFDDWKPGGKLIMHRYMGSTPLHEIVLYSKNIPHSTNSLKMPGYTTDYLQMYTGQGYSQVMRKQKTVAGATRNIEQPGGDLDHAPLTTDTCYIDGSTVLSPYCWTWPKDQWVTILMHVTPGTTHINWPNWPNGGDTGVAVWAAVQGASSYTKIHDASDYPFMYDGGPGKLNPMAYNSIWLCAYMNNTPAKTGWTIRFAEVILAKGDGTSTPKIPCPAV